MTPVRLEPAALRSRVKHSTTEPLRSLINGSKVYPGESSFIFHSKNVAANNVNDLRLIFNSSYIRTKRV